MNTKQSTAKPMSEWTDADAIKDLLGTLEKHQGAIERCARHAKAIRALLSAQSVKVEDAKNAIKTAYGYLWHVNAAKDAPAECNVLSITPEEAAYKARKVLRNLLTHEQIGEGINEVRAAIAMQGDKHGTS
jgi:hypothetical protein